MTTSTVFAGINQLELERARIAQEIHDELGGVLTGLKACISVAIERAARAGLPANPLLDDAAALAGDAFDAVRRIATNLHPAVIDSYGLWAALASQVSALARRSDLGCECMVDSGLAAIDLGRKRELAVFRIVQEALANVERHARASAVSVRAVRNGRWLCLTVADDGIGIGPQRGGASLGMRGMRQRALACNGSLTVCSYGVGTVLRLLMPLGERDGD